MLVDLKSCFADDAMYIDEAKPRTVKMYVRRLHYAETIVGKSALTITGDDLIEVKKTLLRGELHLGRESVKGLIVAVRVYKRWGNRKGYCEMDGVEGVKVPKIPPSIPHPIPLDEVVALLDACRTPLEFRLIYPGFYLGTRIGESAMIDKPMWGRDGFMKFSAEKKVEGEFREVPIHPELERVKGEICANAPTHGSTLQKVKRRLERRTGIRFVSHQMRDTFSTSLSDEGVSDRVVKKFLGHAQDVTGAYIDISRRRQTESILKLPYRPSTTQLTFGEIETTGGVQ